MNTLFRAREGIDILVLFVLGSILHLSPVLFCMAESWPLRLYFFGSLARMGGGGGRLNGRRKK